jgi:septal ring factor EnvC (AmiA/AmiB activator)
MKSLLTFFLSWGFILTATAQQAAPDPAVTKLRESLKNTMLQLRTEQTEKATLQAEKQELEAKNAALTAQVAALGKQLAADKTAADKAQADLSGKLDQQQKDNAALKTSLTQWKEGYNKAATLAKAKEAQRVKLSDQVIELQRVVADRETKNLELYKLGKEILTRYEGFGLGRALLAREPFTGLAKIKLETLIQEYSDKLLDQKVKPAPAPATPAAKPAATAAKQS